MGSKQLGLFNKNPNCPFDGLFEDGDDNCYSLSNKNRYEEISEDSVGFGEWMADVGGVSFDNIKVKDTPSINLPSFLPMMTKNGRKIMDGNNISFLGITIGDIVSIKQHKVKTNIKSSLGLKPGTKLVLMSYGLDKLIEDIWPKRHFIYKELLKLDLDLITSINYSIWFDQCHAEHLINVKRNLLTFQEMQKIGLPAIPNIYWYGQKDLFRWATWLNNNPQVKMVAINLQTLRTDNNWQNAIQDLTYFSKLLKNQIHFLINGPSTPERITQIKNIFSKVTISNKFCASMAASGMQLSQSSGKIINHYSTMSRNIVFRKNTSFYKKLIKSSTGMENIDKYKKIALN